MKTARHWYASASIRCPFPARCDSAAAGHCVVPNSFCRWPWPGRAPPPSKGDCGSKLAGVHTAERRWRKDARGSAPDGTRTQSKDVSCQTAASLIVQGLSRLKLDAINAVRPICGRVAAAEDRSAPRIASKCALQRTSKKFKHAFDVPLLSETLRLAMTSTERAARDFTLEPGNGDHSSKQEVLERSMCAHASTANRLSSQK